jgi:hypothetical protein
MAITTGIRFRFIHRIGHTFSLIGNEHAYFQTTGRPT